MQEMAFLRAQIFSIFGGSMPPDPNRSLLIQYSFCSKSITIQPGRAWLLLLSYDGSAFRLVSLGLQNSISKFEILSSTLFLRAKDFKTHVKFAKTHFLRTSLHPFELRYLHKSYRYITLQNNLPKQRLWNNLPDNIRGESSLRIFKALLNNVT